MTKDELIVILLKQLEDPVRMAEISQSIEDHLLELKAREEEYRIQQQRWWDEHKHDTYY